MTSDTKEKEEAAAEKESFQLPAGLFGAIVIAMVAAVLYLHNFNADVAGWSQSLVAPHVVPPPPDAKPNEVSVQFCQA